MMKRRVFGMLLSLCLVLALIPAAALGEKKISLTVPYTVNVVKGGSAEPGETLFYLEMIKNNGEYWSHDSVTIDCPVVTTNGVGSYSGEAIITGPLAELTKLEKGVFFRQWNMGKDGWEYDPAVWYVEVIPTESGDSVEGVTYAVYPTEYKNGVYSPLKNETPRDKMTFTNTYTKANADVSSLPKTGDSSNLTGWLVLLAVSAAAVAGVFAYSRRRNSARE